MNMNANLPQVLPRGAPDRRLTLPMQELMARVLREARERHFVQLMLVGVAPACGTSLIAQQAAQQLAPAFGAVLLIEVRDGVGAEAVLAGDLQSLLQPGQCVARISLSLQAALALFVVGQAASDTLAARLQQTFALVIWDVPPISQAPIAMAAAGAMDALLLVAEANKTRRQVAQYVAQRLTDSGGQLLGVVLNRTANFIPDWLYRWL